MTYQDYIAFALLSATFCGIAWALCRFALHGYRGWKDARRQKRMRAVFDAELEDLMASDPSRKFKETYTLPVWRSR